MVQYVLHAVITIKKIVISACKTSCTIPIHTSVFLEMNHQV